MAKLTMGDALAMEEEERKRRQRQRPPPPIQTQQPWFMEDMYDHYNPCPYTEEELCGFTPGDQ